MSRFDEIPDEEMVRRWAFEQLAYVDGKRETEIERRPGTLRVPLVRGDRAHIAYFGPEVGVGIAGRDHALRTPEGALEEAAELIVAATLLRDHEERVRTRPYAEAREEILRLEAVVERTHEEVLPTVRALLDALEGTSVGVEVSQAAATLREVLGRES